MILVKISSETTANKEALVLPLTFLFSSPCDFLSAPLSDFLVMEELRSPPLLHPKGHLPVGVPPFWLPRYENFHH